MLSREQVFELAQRNQNGEEVLEDYSTFASLYEYYFSVMPYGIAKARTGDPYKWIENKLDSINE